MRKYSKIDNLCLNFDAILKTLFTKNVGSRFSPGLETEDQITPENRQISAALMRVNHAGEVCAQALYQGQAITSKDPNLKNKLRDAATEEADHLAWCEKRIKELGGHTSYLNPFWYVGSLAIGITAGLCGDKWSLGFLAETEQQVAKHLEKHLNLLPIEDKKSYQILQQMQLEETAHRETAIHAGAEDLPPFIKKLMYWSSQVMVNLAYRV